ncbi:CIC11C00000004783 [Sungouiella intermedia]|uniref:CIC11C00000004783 n=1 Tax=Sungouiella intermedia TaxID=45354 RepID=A0A1L0BRT2_9ASCO|nr:CIC11C00000004783 [[Candida] intermedia]
MPPSPTPPPLNPTRMKTTLKMAISKLKFLQEKKTALTKQQRRQLADLLGAGKESSAKIRVENIIRDDIYIELLEYCELYCELLLARILIILDVHRPTVDPGLKEAILLVIYSSHHTEIKELISLGDMLRVKYGHEFASHVMANENNEYVPEKIVKRCGIEPPSEVLVDLYLTEIARAYEVPYSGLSKFETEKVEEDDDEDDDDEGDGGIKESLEEPIAEEIAAKPSVVKKPVSLQKKEQQDFDDLRARFAALKR